ncbi:hypothetical protein PSCT_04438 [Pseudomonas sp. SCT]|jgi:hypothetical protein|uniref:hypothetical protein n=1 Tax=Pseudomonas sp. (strain SCT) TaxID=412955 RepID=UPI000EC7C9F5|nr:hypothetical protein [Pseudomonas sp. SCT]GCA58218.1 hypothetical protein PSCT_04438 [Pseudomonas sp. SCT]
MKSILGMTALAALMMGAAVTTVQAEGGADRLVNYRLQQEALVSDRASQDSGERFVQLIKEQPTAAGSATEQRDRQMQKQEDSYKSPIHRDRALYGSPH